MSFFLHRVCVSHRKKTKKPRSFSLNARKTRNDVILIVALLLTVSLAALGFFLFSPQGDTVIVTVGGLSYGEYPMDENITVEIKSYNGYNILVIENGSAYVKQASCPDGICASHRPIDKHGESIICLPNEVVVQIKSTNQSEPDIIN